MDIKKYTGLKTILDQINSKDVTYLNNINQINVKEDYFIMTYEEYKNKKYTSFKVYFFVRKLNRILRFKK